MKKRILLVFVLSLVIALLASGIAIAAPPAKVDVCHSEGNGSYHLINISENALPAHLAHGDGLPGDPVPGMEGKKFAGDCSIVDAVTVEPGYDPDAVIKADVKYRALVNPGGLNGYEGILQSGPQIDFYRGVLCDGTTGVYGSWQPSNHVVFSYDPSTGMLTTDLSASHAYCKSVNVGPLGALNYVQFDVVNRRADTVVNFTNVTVNGVAVGDFVSTGWQNWNVKGLDLSGGFVIEGDLELNWPTPPPTSGQETNKLVILVGEVQ
jgi:hypothetical protein